MTSRKTPERLDEQLSEPKALDFDYSALNAETRIFVQQRTSEIQALMRRATDSIFDIRQKLLLVTVAQIHKNYVFGYSTADSILDIQQKLIQATAVQIRINYVFGCSPASALNSRLSVSFAKLVKVHIQLGVLQDLQKWIAAFKCSQNKHLDLATNFIFSLCENLDVKRSHIFLIFSLCENLGLALTLIFSLCENLDG